MAAGGLGLSGLWLLGSAGCEAISREASEAARRGDSFTLLTDLEASQLTAFAERIIPSDDGPGAVEAGAVYFMDTVFQDQEAGNLTFVRDGVAGFEERVRSEGAESGRLADLDPVGQLAVMRGIEAEEPGLFGYLRLLVIAGTFGHPDYGGNRDHLGWRMVGLEPAETYEPPFGFYDADAHGTEGA